MRLPKRLPFLHITSCHCFKCILQLRPVEIPLKGDAKFNEHMR